MFNDAEIYRDQSNCFCNPFDPLIDQPTDWRRRRPSLIILFSDPLDFVLKRPKCWNIWQIGSLVSDVSISFGNPGREEISFGNPGRLEISFGNPGRQEIIF